jgi:hypothetical protein
MRTPAIAAIVLVAACEGAGNRPAEWSYIQPAIFEPSCATVNCHSTAARRAELDFEDFDEGCQTARGNVLPGDPDTSPLVQRLRANPDYGVMMPPDIPLPESEILIVEAWVLDGAPCE